MDKTELFALLTDPNQFHRISLADLEAEIEAAPYAGFLYGLKAVASHEQQSTGFPLDLERAGARVLSRRHLRERIEGPATLEIFWESVPTLEEEIPSEADGVEETPPVNEEETPILADPSQESPEEPVTQSPVEPTSPEEATPATALAEATFPPDEPAAELGENGFTFGFVRKGKKKKSSPEPVPAVAYQLESSPPVRKPKARPEDVLIDTFLEKNPSIQSPRIPFGGGEEEKDLAVHSVILAEEIVTENMAFIYMKQKNFAKARETFRKLQLKFPEKSDYFAALIKNLDAQLPT